jgi:glycolate oxidase FAD binding subunit
VISPETWVAAAGLSGRVDARSGDAGDQIDQVQPRAVVAPDSAETLAALLAWASRGGLSVVLRGSGTKLAWGRRPAQIDLVVSTHRLNRVVAHQHGDLTATVEAGATIGALNHELARHGQWLPADVAFAEATIGGTIAANDSGPLRHRHGTPRDLLIGVHLALTDGRVVKAGGNVVKNVAGYDLGKLMSGSFGSLAAIVGATFKLAPLPPFSRTVVASFDDHGRAMQAASAVADSQLEPAAFEVSVVSAGSRTAPVTLLLQFASAPAAVDAQLEEARNLLAADELRIVGGVPEVDLWREHTRGIWSAPGAVIRLSWLPASLATVLGLVEDLARSGASAVALVGRVAVGAGLVRLDAGATAQVAAIERLRREPRGVGNVVVLRADAAVKDQIDVWAVPSEMGSLLRALKAALDPAGILSAGRGPV